MPEDSQDSQAAEPHRNGGTLPHVAVDLSKLPLKEALSMWHESVNTVCETRLRRPSEDRLDIRQTAFHFGDFMLGLLETVPQEFRRSRTQIARDGVDSYSVHFVEQGRRSFHNRQPDRLAQPDELYIVDNSEPFVGTMVAPFTRDLAIFVPRRLLAPFLAEPEGHNTRVLPAAAPLVSLLRDHLRALFREAPNMTPGQARTVVEPTLRLAAAALNGAATDDSADAVRGALVEQIRRFVDSHLLDPDLSVETIAARFGISPRTLYRWFEPYGGVASYIQRKRLQRAHAAIIDPAHRRENIHDIAERHGFMHRKNFIVAFRNAYGMTPREARAFAMERGPREAVGARGSSNVWHWIHDLK